MFLLDSLALELQHSIINTIYFLKEFFGYIPSIHLRHMYLRWNLGECYRGQLSVTCHMSHVVVLGVGAYMCDFQILVFML